jgi:predicted metal-dependent hydrolase
MPSELSPQITRKPIKNLRLAIKPPEGSVHVSAPLRVTEKAIRDFVESRRGWIERKQAEVRARVRMPAYRYETGEVHYLQGIPHDLRVVHREGRASVRLNGDRCIELVVPVASELAIRQRLLQNWYREQLGDQLPSLLEKWQERMGVHVNECRIKRMKTRWGSCNPRAKRIWINLELAKRPVEQLECILVHELVHLIERSHNKRFYGLMDEFLPGWRVQSRALDLAPPPV